MKRMDFKLEHAAGGIFHLKFKNKYQVRIDILGNNASCTCEGFCWGITKNRECKHIKHAKKYIKEVMLYRELLEKTKEKSQVKPIKPKTSY